MHLGACNRNARLRRWPSGANSKSKPDGNDNVDTDASPLLSSTLSNDEKLAYINAGMVYDPRYRSRTNTPLVKCLMRAPSKIPAGEVPGAKSRYDDFVGMHVNQTLFIHFTGSFFAWHRYFVWSYERALRDECGYKDYLPYWNWGKSAKVSCSHLLGTHLKGTEAADVTEVGPHQLPVHGRRPVFSRW